MLRESAPIQVGSAARSIRYGNLGAGPREFRPKIKNVFVRHPTTRIERFLLIATIVVLPLQDYIPPMAGFSVLFIVFVVLATYVFLNRPGAVARTWRHPTFMAAYVLLVLAFLIESSHPESSYNEIIQTGLMIAGGVIVASLCRDRQAMRTCFYGYLVAGVWMSVLLCLTSYGVLIEASATDFTEASRIREAANDLPSGWNLNSMAYISAQAAMVALVLALTATSSLRRNLLLGATLFCAISTFLPMSRGGIMILVLSCGAVLRAYGVNVRVIIAALVLGAGIFLLAPHVVFSRLTFSTEVREGKMEARAQIYSAALDRFPEYALTGIGVGNFWESWGFFNGFSIGRHVYGAHNVFFQTTIYWGLGALLALIMVLVQAYRCLPKSTGGDPLTLCLVGLSVCLLLRMLVIHSLFAKEFSLGLGLLIGSRCWIWPNGIAAIRSRPSCRYAPSRRL